MKDLNDWLTFIESQHPSSIELGLERVAQVAAAGNLQEFACPVVTVAGTNGKGSTVRALEAILIAMGARVCAYTSPHLIRYNERVRVNGASASDQSLVSAFQTVEKLRKASGSSPLTYFEFGTLAALCLFRTADPDIVLLEVGLGGRLDAVNIVKPNLAIITTIALDHQDWLGDDLISIGAEKAGILRSNIPVILGQNPIAESVSIKAAELQCAVMQCGEAFDVVKTASETHEFRWAKHGGGSATLIADSTPKLPAISWASALQGMQLLLDARLLERQPLPEQHLKELIAITGLPGRFSQHAEFPYTYFDVAHNPQAAGLLGENLRRVKKLGSRLHAVFGMLEDKDVGAVIDSLIDLIDTWTIADLSHLNRGLSSAALQDQLAGKGLTTSGNGGAPSVAYQQLRNSVDSEDLVIVFGSFHVVGEILGKLAMSDSKG